jgi:hypothetical protein
MVKMPFYNKKNEPGKKIWVIFGPAADQNQSIPRRTIRPLQYLMQYLD